MTKQQKKCFFKKNKYYGSLGSIKTIAFGKLILVFCFNLFSFQFLSNFVMEVMAHHRELWYT